MRKIMKNLFWDMDGVLFQWKELDGLLLNLLETAEYFEALPPQAGMDRVLKSLKGNYRLWICSVAYSDAAIRGKNLSLDRHFPGLFPEKNRIFIPKGEDKAEWVSHILGRKLRDGDILFDDHSPNCQSWEDAGGNAVKVLNGINGKGRKWHGKCMDSHGRMITRSSLTDEAARQLLYGIYLRSARDYVALSAHRDRNSLTFLEEKEISDIERFFREDPYGFGTERICRMLRIPTMETVTVQKACTKERRNYG